MMLHKDLDIILRHAKKPTRVKLLGPCGQTADTTRNKESPSMRNHRFCAEQRAQKSTAYSCRCAAHMLASADTRSIRVQKDLDIILRHAKKPNRVKLLGPCGQTADTRSMIVHKAWDIRYA